MKVKFNLGIIAFLVFFFLENSISWAQRPKFSGSLKYIEQLIEDKILREAVPYNKTVLKRIKVKLGQNSPQFAQAFVNDCYLRTLIGQHDGISEDLESIHDRVWTIFSDTGVVAFNILMRGTDAYHEVGNFMAAKRFLEKADQVLAKSKFIPSNSQMVAFGFRKALNLNERGFYLLARSTSDSLAKIQESRLLRTETIKDSKGNLKVVAIVGKERRKRKEQYADIIILNAKTYLYEGNYRPCYAKVRENNSWITENLGSQNQYFAQNNNIQGYLDEAYGEYDQAPTFYKKSLKKHQEWDKTNILTSLNSANSYTISRRILLAEKQMRLADIKINSKYGVLNTFKLKWELINYSKSVDFIPNKFNEKRLKTLQSEYYSLDVNDPLKIDFLENYVEVYKRFNRIADAEDSLKKALEIKKLLYGEDSPEYHALRLKLGEFYFTYTNDFAKVEEIYKSSFLDVIATSRAKTHKDYVAQLTDLARFYELLDKYDLALKYAQEAADTEKDNSGEYSGKYATALGYLAKILTKNGSVQQAQEILSTSTQILKKNAPKTDEAKAKYAETYESIANIYNILGMYSEAQSCLKLANKLSNRIRNSNLAINNTEELASFYIQTGLYENAEELLKETIRQKEKSSKNFKREIISPLNQLGELYLIQGEYGLAEKNIRKAMSISAEIFGDSSIKYIESLKNLVELYSAIGDNEKAISNSVKALSLSKVRYGTNHIEYAKELRAFALIKYNGKFETEDVESLLKQSLEIIKSNLTDKNPLYAEGLRTLAYIYFRSNRLDESEKLAKEANDIWMQKLGPINLNTAKVNLLLGDIYKSRRDFPKAEVTYLAAQKVFGKIFNEKHPDFLSSESRLGQLYLAKGDPEKAIVYFDKTTTIYLDFIKKFFPSLSFREKTKFWDSFKEEFELFDLVAFKLKDKNPKYLGKVYDHSMATKALLLSTSIKVREHIMRSGNQALIDEYSDWITKKELLTRAVSMTKEQLDAAKIDIPKIEKEIEQNEKFLSEQSELFAKNSETRAYKWVEFKKKLSAKEYVVEILRFRDYTNQFSDSIIYAALIIGAKTDKNPEPVILPEGKALEARYLRNFRNSVRYQLDDEISNDHFWKPVKSKIPDNTTIYVSCEGVYNQVNLETMRNADGTYAFDKNNIILLSNTKDLLVAKSKDKGDTLRSNNNRVALFGNPMYYTKLKSAEPTEESQQRGFNFIAGNLSDSTVVDSLQNPIVASNETVRSSGMVKERVKQLPGAEYEVKDINGILSKKNWKSEVYVFAEADEEKIKEIVNPQVFHIATHGFFMEDAQSNAFDDNNLSGKNNLSNNPLIRSGLLLKEGGDVIEKNDILSINNQNGVLTAYEAMNLNFDNTELVVLSACETGLGKVQIGEGVFGLQRAFLVAGADAVIMSLFKVNDKVTQELMEIFYQKWLDGMSKRNAFRAAKSEVKLKYPQPIYWGAFIMVGGN